MSAVDEQEKCERCGFAGRIRETSAVDELKRDERRPEGVQSRIRG